MLKLKLPGLNLKNPIIPASGCFGFGKEFSELYDLNILGALTTKAVTKLERNGNPTPRIAETDRGMLNSIGLQNPGVDNVIKNELSWLKKFKLPIIVNVAGSSIEEYVEVSKLIAKSNLVNALELNISCPNVKDGGIIFGTEAKIAYNLTKAVREKVDLPLYVKLSPNVSNIIEIAKAVELAGADGISLINTLIGMRLDLKTGKPVLANKIGGLSGPAIKPIAIKMVYEVYQNVDIPIIGMGGIQNAADVLEFMYAGASAVGIGSANFVNPYICPEIIAELPQLLKDYGFNDIKEVIGYAHK